MHTLPMQTLEMLENTHFSNETYVLFVNANFSNTNQGIAWKSMLFPYKLKYYSKTYTFPTQT